MAVPSLSPSLSRDDLRKAARAARKAHVAALDPMQKVAQERALHRALGPAIAESLIVGAYVPVGSEIDPLGASYDPERTAFPAFFPSDERFRFLLGAPIIVGPHGIPQPVLTAPSVHPGIVLVPLLAIDPLGNRLGQGGGHYDRVLSPLRDMGVRLIGVGWDVQRLDFVMPVEPWDVPLDGFASPSGLEMFR